MLLLKSHKEKTRDKKEDTKFCGLKHKVVHEIVCEKNVEKNLKKLLTTGKTFGILSERSRERQQS